MAVTSLVIVS